MVPGSRHIRGLSPQTEGLSIQAFTVVTWQTPPSPTPSGRAAWTHSLVRCFSIERITRWPNLLYNQEKQVCVVLEGREQPGTSHVLCPWCRHRVPRDVGNVSVVPAEGPSGAGGEPGSNPDIPHLLIGRLLLSLPVTPMSRPTEGTRTPVRVFIQSGDPQRERDRCAGSWGDLAKQQASICVQRPHSLHLWTGTLSPCHVLGDTWPSLSTADSTQGWRSREQGHPDGTGSLGPGAAAAGHSEGKVVPMPGGGGVEPL